MAEVSNLGQGSTGSAQQWEAQKPQQVFSHCCSVVRTLREGYSHHRGQGDSGNSPVLASLALDSLLLTTNICCTHFKEQLSDVLKNIVSGGEGAPEDQAISWFQKEIEHHLGTEDAPHGGRQAVALLQALGCIVVSLPADSPRLTRLWDWLHRLCLQSNPADSSTGKGLLAELLQLTTQEKSCAKLLCDIAADAHAVIGDVDQEVDGMEHELKCINESGGLSVLSLVLKWAEHELTDADWFITRLRAPLQTACSSYDAAWREGCERTVCSRLGHLVNTFHELVQTAVPPGNPADSTLRTLVHLYNTMATLSKYWLGVYRQGPVHLAPRFEKLVKLSGTNLSQYVYSFVTYIQAAQKENLNITSAKGKGKKEEKPSANKGVVKESRSVPSLIYAMEQYERYLIQLSKRTKVNLMDGFKRSTARDFRINATTVQEVLEHESDSEPDITQQESEGEQEEEEEPTSSKRQKQK